MSRLNLTHFENLFRPELWSVVIWEYSGERVFQPGCIVMAARLGRLQDRVDYTRFESFCSARSRGVSPAFIMGTDQPPYPPINRCKGQS